MLIVIGIDYIWTGGSNPPRVHHITGGLYVWQYIFKKLEKLFSIERDVERLNKLYDKAFIATYNSNSWLDLQAAHKLLVRLEAESKHYGDLTFQAKVDKLKLHWLNKYRNWKRYL
jgi:hypothetical protein